MSNAANHDQRASKVRSLLRALHATLAEVEASAVVSRDGITVASLMAPSADKDRFGAMCASLLALADRAAREVDRGRLRQVILDGTGGPMLLTQAGDTVCWPWQLPHSPTSADSFWKPAKYRLNSRHS